MKKFLAILLMLVLCLAVLASCDLDAFSFGTLPEKENETEVPGGETTDDPVNPDPPKTDNVQAQIDAAVEYLRVMYLNDNGITSASYTLPAIVSISVGDDIIPLTAEWSIEVADEHKDDVKVTGKTEDGKHVQVAVNDKVEEDVAYKLIATFTVEGKTGSISFDRTVPAYHEFDYADYSASQKGDNVVVKGVISGIVFTNDNKVKAMYVNDEVGGYYVYSLNADSAALPLKVGQTVKVTGEFDNYNGTFEIKDGIVEVLDETVQALVAEDYTEIYKNAKDLKAEELVKNQAHLVTIKGVEITGQDLGSGYFKFKLEGKESYIRISSSVCPMSAEDQAAFKKGHTEHTGWIANATGVISVYSGAFYLTPVSADAFEYLSLPEKSDAEAVAYEKENLTFADRVKTASELDLVATGATYSKVAITWALDGEYDFAKIENGKLLVTLPDEDTTITLTATLTAGETSDTKEFSIAVDAAPKGSYVYTPAEAIAEGNYKIVLDLSVLEGGVLYFDGTVTTKGALNTTDKAADAADVTVVAVDGGYNLKVGDQYLVAYKNGTYNNLKLDGEAGLWTWNSDLKVFVANVEGTDVYFGSYKKSNGTANTKMSLSALTYISGDNASKIGESQFPGIFATVEFVEEQIEHVKEGEYLFVIDQKTLGTTLYFNGEVNSSEYLATVESKSAAATVVVAKTLTGYTLSVGGKYIEVYENADQKVRIHLVDEPTASWVWDDDAELLTFVLSGCAKASNDGVYYLGTYKDFNTFSASKTTSITGNNAANVGVSQFPGQLIEKVDEPVDPEEEYEITVTAENAQVALSIEKGKNGTEFTFTVTVAEGYKIVSVKVNGVDIEATEGVYTASIDGETKVAVVAAKVYPAPAEGTYLFYLEQANLKSTLYATGSMSGSYLATSENKAEAAVLTLAKNEKGYTLALNGKYINLLDNGTGKAKIELADTSSVTWDWDETLDVFTCTITSGTFYLGTYKTFNTFSASTTSYISGANAANVGVSQFPSKLVEYVVDPEAEYEITVEAENAQVTLSTEKGKIGTAFTFTVTVAEGYDLVSVKVNDVAVEATEGVYTATINGAMQIVVTTAQQSSGEQQETKTARVVISDYAATHSWSDATFYSTITFDGFNVTASGGSNTGKYYRNGENWRFYQSENPTMLISAPNGDRIVSVTVTYLISNNGILAEKTTSTKIQSGQVYAVNAQDVTFTVLNTGTKTNGQVRVTAIEITYIESDPETPAVVVNN